MVFLLGLGYSILYLDSMRGFIVLFILVCTFAALAGVLLSLSDGAAKQRTAFENFRNRKPQTQVAAA